MRRKNDIVARLLADFLSGADIQLSKIKSSDIGTWGYPAYTQRGLRRMFTTRGLEKGIDAKVIPQSQGRQDGGKLILGTYSHARNVHAAEIAKKLG